MNRAALARSELTLRVIPPRAGCGYFPTPPNYADLLSAIQRLRGSRYVADGAIPATALDAQGRHITAEDEQSYHLALWNGEVQGCLRVQIHRQPERHFTGLRVYDLIKRMPADMSKKYHAAMEEFLRYGKDKNYQITETGGWAVSTKCQFNASSFALPLARWSFSRILPRQISIAAATERNGSAEMLRRLGGWRLKLNGEELPPFHDPAYNCQMELLCFDSDILNPKFEPAVMDLKRSLEEQCTIRSGATATGETSNH